MKKKPQFKDEYVCPGCGYHGSVKSSMLYRYRGKMIRLCKTCYRYRTAPTTEDIMREIILVKTMIERRHEMLWAKQIKKNKRNIEPNGSPATASLKIVDEIVDTAITGLLFHDKVSPSTKKSHKK